MDRVATGVAAEVAVERRANVIEFVEHRHQFLVESLVEEPGQAKGEQVEHLAAAHEETLHLIFDRPVAAREPAISEPQRSDPSLEPVATAVPRWREADQYPWHVDVPQRLAPVDNIGAESGHGGRKIEGRRNAGGGRNAVPTPLRDHPAGGQRAARVPAQFEWRRSAGGSVPGFGHPWSCPCGCEIKVEAMLGLNSFQVNELVARDFMSGLTCGFGSSRVLAATDTTGNIVNPAGAGVRSGAEVRNANDETVAGRSDGRPRCRDDRVSDVVRWDDTAERAIPAALSAILRPRPATSA